MGCVVEAGWHYAQAGIVPPARNVRLDFGGGNGSLGGPAHVALPAAVNAHDHGRAISTLAAGVADDVLERWIPASQRVPCVDAGLEATVALARMARAGIAATQICHDAATLEAGISGAVAIAGAARKVGIRVEIALPVYDMNLDGYVSQEGRLLGLPASDMTGAAGSRAAAAPIVEQIAAVEEAASRAEGGGVTVAFHAVGLPWCSPALFSAVAERSMATGRRVFMHLLETGQQRRWADAAYDSRPLHMLDEAGLLSDRLACAHGVHLRDSEIALLAERGVTVSVNTSSNLRLASGIAAVPDFVRAGLRFGLGIDSFGWSDDPDPWSEARLCRLVHRGRGSDHSLDDSAVLTALSRGHRPGDLVLFDLDRLAPDRLEQADPLALILARGSSAQVTDLLVEGRPVMRAGRVLGVDAEASEAELRARLRLPAR